MSKKITEIEGIGATYASKLSEAGILTVEQLLEKGARPAGRKGIAESTGISPKLILRWVNMADLFRIKGVGEEYADLLEAAGVDTVKELAQRNAANLTKAMAEVNETKKLVRAVPSEKSVTAWVAEAKTMDRAVHY